MGDFVRNMHESSGLLTVLDDGLTMAEAEEQVLDYVREFVPEPRKAPLAGNTIGTDRAFLARDMPSFESYVHYRNVDVSSIKELVRRWYPRAYYPRRPSPATTGRWPTSRSRSRSCATTATRCSSRCPDRTAPPPRWIAARHQGALTGAGGATAAERPPAAN